MTIIALRIFQVSIPLTKCFTISGSLPSSGIITQFVEKYVKPYLGVFQAPEPEFKSKKSDMNKLIDDKITKLMPLLQDNDIDLIGKAPKEGDTLIMEYTPVKDKKTSKKRSKNKQNNKKRSDDKPSNKEGDNKPSDDDIDETEKDFDIRNSDNQKTGKKHKHHKDKGTDDKPPSHEDDDNSSNDDVNSDQNDVKKEVSEKQTDIRKSDNHDKHESHKHNKDKKKHHKRTRQDNDENKKAANKKMINKYKEMRDNIKMALEKESISTKTKKLVTNTLDNLLSNMNGTECMWRSSDSALITFRNSLLTSVQNVSLDEWNELKHLYNDTNKNVVLRHDSLKTFIQFHKFFSKLLNQSKNVDKRYKISCHLIDLQKPNSKPALRQKSKCEFFKVCSLELGEFLKDYYKILNDTSVGVFSNYAAVYVKNKSMERDNVKKSITNLKQAVENKVEKVFTQHIQDFNLDSHKNANNNVKLIKDFIRQTVNTVLSGIKEILDKELRASKDKLKLAADKDIRINLNIDMGNLKRDILTSVCEVFSSCNGRETKTRRSNVLTNNIHLELDVKLDDDFQKNLINTNKFFRSVRRSLPQIKNDFIFKVTRTTTPSSVTMTYQYESNLVLKK